MIQINGESMTLRMKDESSRRIRYGEHAAANGGGSWIVSTHPARLFSRNEDHGPDPRRAPGRRLSPTATARGGWPPRAPSPCSALVVAMVSARACRSGVAVCTKAESQVTWVPGGRLARHAADTAD
jgi:hypothetical protein